MRILAVATHSERWFPGFVESCRRHKLELDILGWGKDWRGFSWRFELYKERLSQLPATELILITDAFDTLMLAFSDEIESKFNKFGSDIVFSTEPKTHFAFECLKWSLFGSYNRRVINGGTYIGRAGALLGMMQEIKYENKTDDQKLLTQYCKEHKCTVDWRGELFLHYLTVFPSKTIKSIKLRDGRLFVQPDSGPETSPVLVTVAAAQNGPRKMLMELGYDDSQLPYIPNRYRWQKVKLYFPMKYLLIIITVIAIIVVLAKYSKMNKM